MDQVIPGKSFPYFLAYSVSLSIKMIVNLIINNFISINGKIDEVVSVCERYTQERLKLTTKIVKNCYSI